MKSIYLTSVVLAVLALSGCESKQAKLAALKAQYDPLNKQYYDECIEPAYGAKGAEAYFKGTQPKVPTPQEEAAHNQKCAQELKQVTSLEQQMQALQK